MTLTRLDPNALDRSTVKCVFARRRFIQRGKESSHDERRTSEEGTVQGGWPPEGEEPQDPAEWKAEGVVELKQAWVARPALKSV